MAKFSPIESSYLILFISCCNLCNKDDKNQSKEKQRNTQILHGSTVYLHPRERRLKLFAITEIGLHRRVFIITLDMTKLKKYSYTLNILYRTTWASRLNPNLLFRPQLTPPQQKRLCMKGKYLLYTMLKHLPSPSSLNTSHMPLQSPPRKISTSLKKTNQGLKTPPGAISRGIFHLASRDINQVHLAVLELFCGNRLCQHVCCILRSMNLLEQ